ncbi:MAG: hypothetical protein AAGA59_18935 [Actinomycetota bacterium]
MAEKYQSGFAIRHSRTVDEVTRMDVDAALSWFGDVLTATLPGD